MSLVYFVYLADVIPTIRLAIIRLSLLCLLVMAVVTVILLIASDDIENSIINKLRSHIYKKVTLAIIIALFTASLLPSKTTMYLMIGSYLIENVVKSDKTSALTQEVYNIVLFKLRDISKEDSTGSDSLKQ